MSKYDFPSETKVIKSSCGKFYVTTLVSKERRGIYKVLINAGKAGGCASAQLLSFQKVMDKTLVRDTIPEILETITEFTSQKCYMPDCCINLIAHYLLKKELKLLQGGG